jgi:hypothetical protein
MTELIIHPMLRNKTISRGKLNAPGNWNIPHNKLRSPKMEHQFKRWFMRAIPRVHEEAKPNV